jgi:hypothetical protein
VHTLDERWTTCAGDLRPNYRLCKGVYVEPRDISFHDMRVINRNYAYILGMLRPAPTSASQRTTS